MPIPYRDADDLNELGTAGYLKIEPSSAGSGYLGVLFLINARGVSRSSLPITGLKRLIPFYGDRQTSAGTPNAS